MADRDVLLPGVELNVAPSPPVTRPPMGWTRRDDGRVALGAVVPLGVLQARVAGYLAAIGAPLVVTLWRSVLVCDLDDAVADAAQRMLAPMGLAPPAALASRWVRRACTRTRFSVST